MSGLIHTTDNIYVLRFLRLLTTQWQETNAYKYGIIDADGNTILKSRDIPKEHKQYYTYFHRLVFNIKRLIQKIPIVGRSILTSYITGLLLIKEEIENESGQKFTEEQLEELLAMISDKIPETTNLNEEILENEGLLLSETMMTTGASGVADTSVSLARPFRVFDVDDATYKRFVDPKKKFKKWSDYIDSELEEDYPEIRKCATNKQHIIVLRSKQSGAACTLRNYKFPKSS